MANLFWWWLLCWPCWLASLFLSASLWVIAVWQRVWILSCTSRWSSTLGRQGLAQTMTTGKEDWFLLWCTTCHAQKLYSQTAQRSPQTCCFLPKTIGPWAETPWAHYWLFVSISYGQLGGKVFFFCCCLFLILALGLILNDVVLCCLSPLTPMTATEKKKKKNLKEPFMVKRLYIRRNVFNDCIYFHVLWVISI